MQSSSKGIPETMSWRMPMDDIKEDNAIKTKVNRLALRDFTNP